LIVLIVMLVTLCIASLCTSWFRFVSLHSVLHHF
jgi:hypothetical protein